MQDVIEKRLEEIVTHLPDVPGFISLKKRSSGKSAEYDVFGDMVSWCLHNEQNISIAHTYFSEGTMLPMHTHGVSYEIIFVTAGELTLISEEGVRTLREREWIHINPNQQHSAIAEKPTWIIAITVPKDEGFPT